MESCLGEWTPRNKLLEKPTAAAEPEHSCTETLRSFLVPRLVRVLAPFPEARAAVVEMFLEMHRAGVEVPGCPG